MFFNGSSLTHSKDKIKEIEASKEPLSYTVFGMYAYEHERWLYHALNLSKKNPRAQRLMHNDDYVLFPMEDCTVYIAKPKAFPKLLRKVVDRFLPFRAGLLDPLMVSLWDEDDTFKEMNVTGIEKTDTGFIVEYTSPTGENMTVTSEEMGNDEVMNLLEGLYLYDQRC